MEWLGPKTGEFPQAAAEVPLGSGTPPPMEPRAVAANYKTGDVYEADGSGNRVLRFDKEGRFLEGWGWGVGDGAEHFERCGPDGEPLYPTCGHKGPTGGGGEGGKLNGAIGIAVDQATGNVFVMTLPAPFNAKIIAEFGPAGEYLASFGQNGNKEGEPERAETIYSPRAIAVGSGSVVYLVEGGTHRPSRVMVFEPNLAGEYTYERDLFRGKFEAGEGLSLDAEGRYYLAAEGHIYRFDTPSATSPSWEISVPETEGATVDPATGEVIYYEPKTKTGATNVFHRVKPVGSAEEVDTPFAGAVSETHALATAFNPDAVLNGRAAGALYAAEPFDGLTRKAARGLIFSPSAQIPPTIDSESATGIGTMLATLEAQVNPKGFPTHYRFEYGSEGPCSKMPCSEAPLGGGDAGLGTVDRGVSVELSHLAPGTTYYYRLVAENQFGVVEGSDASFRTYPLDTGLPDGRAYELVSPAEKHGGEVIPASPEIGSCNPECQPGRNSPRMPSQSAPDGESIVYQGLPFFPSVEGERGPLTDNEYRSVRTPSGWQTTNLSFEHESEGSLGYRAFTADLATGVLHDVRRPLAEGALPTGYEDLYEREANGTLLPFVRELLEPLPAKPAPMGLVYASGSSDLRHVAFESRQPLTPATPVAPQAPPLTGSLAGEEERDLYEWTEGRLRLVNVLPENHAAVPGAVIGAGKLLGPTSESAPVNATAVSSDGSRIFWTALETGKLFVREAGETTREIAYPGSCKSSLAQSERVCFLAASADGSKVLISNGRVYDDTTEPATELFDLTKGHNGFQGIVGSSADLSVIYFVDTEVITTSEGPTHAVAQAGKPNLYIFDSGTGAARFIGTLKPEDDSHGQDIMVGSWVPAAANRVAQATPDGRFLAFDSIAPLTGYDNVIAGESCGEHGPKACSEVYEYDAQANTLTCVSCNPTGAPPAGRSTLSLLKPIASAISALPQPRNLTPSGRVFFDSFDAVTAGDHYPGVENVYEYEQQGQGSCATAGGCLGLISSGSSSLDASFLSADESGKNVFFTTRQALLPEDHDELVDLYDAREGGGFTFPTSPEPCSGEGCRPAPTPPAILLPAASTTFVGLGNRSPAPDAAVEHSTSSHPPAKKCPKGKARNTHHRCVRVRSKARRAGHRSSGKQGVAHR